MKTYRFIAVQLTTSVLAACSGDIEPQHPDPFGGQDDGRVPVEFSVSAQRNCDFTRATSSIVSFSSGEAVKVCVSTDDGSSYTGYDFTTAAAGQSVSLSAPAVDPPYPENAWRFAFFFPTYLANDHVERYYGYSVRAVQNK